MYQRIILILTLAISLAACSENKLTPLSGSAKILAFGDSLTAGKGVNIEHSYPTVLAQLSGLEVINAGISGELTQQGLARFSQLINEVNPELIVLLEGGNDILQNNNLAQTKQHLDAMITLAKEQNMQIVLVGVPKKSLFSSSAKFYSELADKHALVFNGEIIAELLKNQQYKSDSVHFNQAGYKKLAATIHQLLLDNGAL
ncbi:MAG: GDSL-type esterase/lipase family protein [Oceanospirillaceae bacterium]